MRGVGVLRLEAGNRPARACALCRRHAAWRPAGPGAGVLSAPDGRASGLVFARPQRGLRTSAPSPGGRAVLRGGRPRRRAPGVRDVAFGLLSSGVWAVRW